MPAFEQHARWRRIVVYISCVVIGGMSGFVGGFATQYAADIPDITQFQGDLSRPTILEDIRGRDTNEVPMRVLENSASSVVRLYGTAKRPGERQGLFFSETSFLGIGVAVTADGWLLAPQRLAAEKIKDISVIDASRKSYAVDALRKDPALGVVYIHAVRAQFKPVQVAGDILSYANTQAMLLTPDGALEQIALSLPRYPVDLVREGVHSSDVLERMFNPSQIFAVSGLPIFSRQGELIGVSGLAGIIPGGYIKDSLPRLLKNKGFERPHLGVSYVDLTASIRVRGSAVPQASEKGALVSTDKKIPLHTSQSGDYLLDGDIVVGINDETIDENRTFSELLQQYSTADVIIMRVLRGTAIKTFKVIL